MHSIERANGPEGKLAMAELSFIIDDIADVEVTVCDDGMGGLTFKLKVLDSGSLADIRGLFFNIDGVDPDSLTAIGDDITNQGADTRDLGKGNNMKGKAKSDFDFGVSIGKPGLKGGKDDIQMTEFTVTSSDGPLSAEDVAGELFGVRLTSVEDPDGGPCESYTIDFEGFDAGDTVDTIIIGGVTVMVAGDENAEGNADNDAMIFDAANVTGGDDDLGFHPAQGKILIISEDDDSTDPDDSGDGGTLVFDFSEEVNVNSIVIIDADGGGTITSDQGDMVDIGNLEDGALMLFDLGFEDVNTLTVTFTGSGAVDDLSFEVCEPGERDESLKLIDEAPIIDMMMD